VAAPQVAAMIAILADLGLTNTDIKQRLFLTADDVGAAGFDNQTGWGRLNAWRALASARPPSSLFVSSAMNQVTLSWVAPQTKAFSTAHYRIYRSATPGGPYSLIGQTSDGSALNYDDTTAIAQVAYYYVVKAEDIKGLLTLGSNEGFGMNLAPTATPTATFSPTGTCTHTPTITDTLTVTETPTVTDTASFTPTATNTPTVTLTPTGTSTASHTPTATASTTRTFTPTPTNSLTPVPPMNFYPNPYTGTGPLKLHLDLTEASDIQVAFFTMGFRKVKEQAFQQAAASSDLEMQTVDLTGKILANGLYFVRIEAKKNPKINKTLKLMILR
jgi:hypothetical protein